MTNLDDSEQSEQKEIDQTMEQEIRSAGNGAFDRSDILYMIESKSVMLTAEEKKKQQLEAELASFRVNALNKKPAAVIAMKEKRSMVTNPKVMIKKKRLRTGENTSKKIDGDGNETDGVSREPVPAAREGVMDRVKQSEKVKEVERKTAVGGLGELLGDYSDSDSDS